MNKNYYEILEINRNATSEDIAQAYRRLAYKYNPSRHSSKEYEVNKFFFLEFAEAYDVLSDPDKRSIYDLYGESGLKKGILDKKGNLKGGYRFAGEKWAYSLYDKFCEKFNTFSIMKDYDRVDDEFGSMFGSASGGMNQGGRDPLKNVEIDLDCTLEELYLGINKTIRYKRMIVNIDGRTTSEKEEEKQVEVLKGSKDKSVIQLKGLGNQCPGYVNSDLIVRIKQIPHTKYKRVGNDLIYYHKITLSQALNAEPINFKSLDNRTLIISVDEIISPQTKKFINCEGFPILNEEKRNSISKGNLIVEFNIIFPNFIEHDKKERLIELLTETD